MNVLILTGKFGMGHYNAALAVEEEILSRNPNACVNIVDIIDYIFPTYSKMIYGNFNFLVRRCSSIYNFFNNIAGQFSDVPLKKTVAKSISRLLEEYKADLIIATLPVCSQYISAFKEMTNKKIPLYTYITDLTIHEEWIAKNTDLYFVGAEGTKNNLISKGIAAEKIIVSGIPVKKNFKDAIDNPDKSKNGKSEVLIMGGGLGLIPSNEDFLSKLCSNDNIHITMITGKNQKLLRDIKERFPSIDVIGYTTEVHHYMKNADIIITKSGGITTFEAINIGTPLYILKPFLMQEVGNAEYIEQENIGRIMWSKKSDVAKDVLALLHNPLLLKSMRLNMKQIKEEWSPSCALSYYNKRGEVA